MRLGGAIGEMSIYIFPDDASEAKILRNIRDAFKANKEQVEILLKGRTKLTFTINHDIILEIVLDSNDFYTAEWILEGILSMDIGKDGELKIMRRQFYGMKRFRYPGEKHRRKKRQLKKAQKR